jgi:hypothetical protein
VRFLVAGDNGCVKSWAADGDYHSESSPNTSKSASTDEEGGDSS